MGSLFAKAWFSAATTTKPGRKRADDGDARPYLLVAVPHASATAASSSHAYPTDTVAEQAAMALAGDDGNFVVLVNREGPWADQRLADTQAWFQEEVCASLDDPRCVGAVSFHAFDPDRREKFGPKNPWDKGLQMYFCDAGRPASPFAVACYRSAVEANVETALWRADADSWLAAQSKAKGKVGLAIFVSEDLCSWSIDEHIGSHLWDAMRVALGWRSGLHAEDEDQSAPSQHLD